MNTSEKTALIIGGSRGLGTEIAIKAAMDGYKIILIGRNKKALMRTDDLIKAKGGSAILVPFDLRNVNLIDQLVLSLVQRISHLDLLVFNAAYMTELRPIAHTPNDIWDDIIAANLTAPMRLLRALDPLIKKSAAPHIIYIMDRFENRAKAYWGAYAVAKAGLQELANIYAQETVHPHGLKTSFFDPGPMSTELRQKAFPGEPAHQTGLPAEAAERLWQEVA